MALINCPDCGHEVATTATACPNCGHPFAPPVIHRNVVVADVPDNDGFPKWAIAVLGILGAVLLFVIFAYLRNSNEDAAANSRSINVNVAARRETSEPRETTRTETQTLTVPPATSAQNVTVPSTSAPSTVTVPPSSSTTVTGVSPASTDRGAVTIDAKIATRSGTPQAVKAEKFYLLDDSLENILSDADLEPIEGQSLTNSFGLSVLYSARYSDFNRDALNAIKKHIKYDTLTDSLGKGQLKDIKPDSYYLFGVTKSGKGFAVWSAPVTIQAGSNILNLSPQQLTEVQE